MGGLKLTQLSHIIKLYKNIYNKTCKHFTEQTHHKIPNITLISSHWTEKLICNWYSQRNDQILTINSVK